MTAQTPQEKAMEGLRLLQEAVVDYLTGRQPTLTTDVRNELGLESADRNGKWKDNLFWGLVLLLKRANRVQTEMKGRRTFIFLTKTEPNADRATQS
jgi:hypothetical protein